MKHLWTSATSSLPRRTKIETSLKTLERRKNSLSYFIQSTEDWIDYLRKLDNDSILHHISYLNGQRFDVILPYRRLETAVDQWRTLAATDAVEKDAYTSFTDKSQRYYSLIAETRETLAEADDVLTLMVEEATNRHLDIPPEPTDSHSLSTSRRPSNVLTSVQGVNSQPELQSTPAAITHISHATQGVPTSHEMVPLQTPRSSMTPRSESPHTEPHPSAHGLAPNRYQEHILSSPPIPHLTPSLFLQSALIGRAQLPSFEGDLVKWPPFKAAFLALLGDASLPGCHKLALLKSCLTGEVLEMIAGLSQIDQDYDTAMAILHAEYDRPTLILHALMTRLQSIENCDPEGKQLCRIYMEITTLIHQLCPEGESDSPDFLVNLIITKLPIYLQTRIMKESQKKTIGVFAVLGIMRDSVDDDRIERMLTVTPHSRSSQLQPPDPPFSPSPSPVPFSTLLPAGMTHPSERTLICPLCKGTHLTKHCSAFASPLDKKNARTVPQLPLHFSSSRFMPKCRLPHDMPQDNSSHPTRPSRQHSRSSHRSNNDPSRDVCNLITSYDHLGNEIVPQDVTLHINSSPLPYEKKTSLLCLDINVASPDQPDKETPVTLVFDTASDKSYISSDLATSLNLPTTQENMRSLTAFGNEKSESRLTTSHPLLLRLPNVRQEKIELQSSRTVCPTLDWAKKNNGILIPRRSKPKILLGMDLLRRYFLTTSLRIISQPLQFSRAPPHPIARTTPSGTATHSQSACPSSLDVSPPSLDRAAVTHSTTAGKDRDNPHSDVPSVPSSTVDSLWAGGALAAAVPWEELMYGAALGLNDANPWMREEEEKWKAANPHLIADHHPTTVPGGKKIRRLRQAPSDSATTPTTNATTPLPGYEEFCKMKVRQVFPVNKEHPIHILIPLPEDDTSAVGRYKGRNPFDLSLKKMRPLMELASEDIYGRGLLPDQSLHFLYKETSLSDAQGPNVAIEALSNKQLNCIIGYAFVYALAPVARMSPYWTTEFGSCGVPVLTTIGNTGNLDDKSEYRLMTRVASPYKVLRQVLKDFLKMNNYTKVSYAFHDYRASGNDKDSTVPVSECFLLMSSMRPYLNSYFTSIGHKEDPQNQNHNRFNEETWTRDQFREMLKTLSTHTNEHSESDEAITRLDGAEIQQQQVPQGAFLFNVSTSCGSVSLFPYRSFFQTSTQRNRRSCANLKELSDSPNVRQDEGACIIERVLTPVVSASEVKKRRAPVRHNGAPSTLRPGDVFFIPKGIGNGFERD
ncbi:hypothetical protein PRIPAC_84139 [Pristionchus pacificus]|uniref:Uncharacterized protein n=1 Tax=Pristionchus pacificus TaxID=54126 RepID=A0A2A6BUN1_PRIPA|nr:hypothetical protein PRIPAC_84139 [Pristionchus pacificus]|eukprot:PDM69567.1 hypothetical protein PRIPAC_44663 [Pristionchus pacificus]